MDPLQADPSPCHRYSATPSWGVQGMRSHGGRKGERASSWTHMLQKWGPPSTTNSPTAVMLYGLPSPATAEADIAVWFDASDVSTMFNDTAGTSPVPTSSGSLFRRWSSKGSVFGMAGVANAEYLNNAQYVNDGTTRHGLVQFDGTSTTNLWTFTVPNHSIFQRPRGERVQYKKKTFSPFSPEIKAK